MRGTKYICSCGAEATAESPEAAAALAAKHVAESHGEVNRGHWLGTHITYESAGKETRQV